MTGQSACVYHMHLSRPATTIIHLILPHERMSKSRPATYGLPDGALRFSAYIMVKSCFFSCRDGFFFCRVLDLIEWAMSIG